jgi:hypothetical protein
MEVEACDRDTGRELMVDFVDFVEGGLMKCPVEEEENCVLYEHH